MTRVTVLGAGSWGTAYGKVLTDAGNDVTLWARRPELAEALTATRENADYLPGIVLPVGLTATSDAVAALDGADYVVIAVPSQSLRDNLLALARHVPGDAVLVSLMKGVELHTSKRMSEVIGEVADVPPERVAVVSGPNLAVEIASEHPAATVISCTELAVAERLQQVSSTVYFRPYTNTDVVGSELGGAVKNVIALAVGMAEGMGYGDNTKASIITRGLAETARLGQALGADPYTFSGLAGLGDLVATCSSPLSRNRTYGERLGRGATVRQLEAQKHQTAEGVKSCRSVQDLARKHDVDMPITDCVVGVVDDGMTPMEALQELMARQTGSE